MTADNSDPDIGRRILWGILLAVLCLFLALSLFSYDWRDISVLQVPPNSPPANLFGPVGAWLSFILFICFGIGAYLVPACCLGMGLILMLNRGARIWPRQLWALGVLIALIGIIQLGDAAWVDRCAALNIQPDAGGMAGRWLVRNLLIRWLSPIGAGVVVWSFLLVAIVMTIELRNISRAALGVVAGGRWAMAKSGDLLAARLDERQRIEREEKQLEKKRRRLERVIQDKQPPRRKTAPAVDDVDDVDDEAVEAAARALKESERLAVEAERPEPKPARKKPLFRQSKPKAEVETEMELDEPAPMPAVATNFVLPPKSILADTVVSAKGGSQVDAQSTADLLVETLAEFGIEGEITDIKIGPVVTSYELLPAAGVRVERISGLSNNLALSLKATSVRVQAPIPGKGVVGIEVPNSVSQLVSIKQVVEGDVWKSGKARLPLILGKDVGGSDIVADLAAMPHLLIAGATGSGKTVCMNTILAGLLMSRTPDQLRLLLVDPKIVEFSVYNRLPHLVVPVITDPKKVALGLRWAINEMERRYKLFAKVGVRNIESFNSREIAKQEDLFGDEDTPAPDKAEPPARVPYIVVVIDELADLMLADQVEIENCIARLAQLSRAVGIHMIIATQRPSVNVITGTIKANFPARIAFQVAQRVDSRTILDTIGADKLLGRGDMLYLPAGSSKLVRVQGAMTTDEEIRAITEFLREQGDPEYEAAIQDKLEQAEKAPGGISMDGGEDDEMIARSIDIIRETQRASTSSLQRRLRIGYTRAARIIDILEERGILGPSRGSEPREILVDLDGDIPNNDEEDEAT
ncbi:MAG: DNA translocase FtsK [Verrucomicrobia bacterium]|nr:DNA translocase FtsK [Verrucomicrobiota bacterium]